MGRGSSGIGGAGAKSNAQKSGIGALVGKRVKDLGITYANVEENISMDNLSTSQKNTLVGMFKGMAQNDYSFDGAKTPYEIKEITVKDLSADQDRSVLQVSVVTGGNTGRGYVDTLDKRYRLFLLGRNGGTYTFTKGGKRKPVSGFEVSYGTRE